MSRIDWGHVLQQAGAIAGSYSTPVTLRQLFYRLVAAGLVPNTQAAYKRLSSLSAEARRQGRFPSLMDRGRSIHRYQTFSGPALARAWLRSIYRRDRTEDQPWAVYLGVEKAGIVAQLQDWFGDYGVPILALGGYSSQSYVDEVVRDVEAEGRSAVLLYAGDHDPSGEDIDRDFITRSCCFAKVERVALSVDQVVSYDLPPQPGKETDSRAARFIARHGALVQVELDALDPADLRGLYQEAFHGYWDVSAYEAALAQEAEERDRL
jgi:hypothetical protein